MKIGIDVSQAVYGGGVGVYVQNLTNALLEIDRTNRYLLFFSSLRKKIPRRQFKTDEIKAFKIPPTALDILWNRLHIWPIENFIGAVDVFHASDWTQPPAAEARLVTTIHDLSFLRWPKSVHPKVLAVQKRRLRWVKKEVDRIIVPSQATKNEVVDLLQISQKKITVTGEGAPEDVKEFALEQAGSGAGRALKIVKQRLEIKKPYLFAYGSKSPRKNIARLIRAFAKIRRKIDCQLVISGDYQPSAQLPAGVVLTGFLPREEMLTLFSGAKTFVYPSLYEGFGLPILEAFALGVPVVTSDTSSMAEVAGKAALPVNPRSAEAIGKGIKKILGDVSIQGKLVKAGEERLKSFSWESTARLTLKVYEKAGG